MIELQLPAPRPSRPRHILCVGAHCDDIDIGCGGTLLKLLARDRGWQVTWVAFGATKARAAELKASARRFLRRAAQSRVVVFDFPDSYFPAHYSDIKASMQSLRELPRPDVIFTTSRSDRHQDHRLVSELTWNTFRDHLILEYEIPKYEGDLRTPNVYVTLEAQHMRSKVNTLLAVYRSQRTKPWFTAETFRALMRLRGIESAAESGWAEGFHGSKVCLG